ncbi:MAG TPA: hypothetical protein VGB85_17375 [Nannocystis sp.]|jgi:hypothetical protein
MRRGTEDDLDAPLRRALSLATRAASPGNTQPWRFRRDGDSLEVHCDDDSEPSTLNHAGRVSAMTLGGLLELLAIALGAEGYQAIIRLPEQSTPGGPWAVVELRPVDLSVDPLVHAIAGRFTDRREYRGGDLGDPVFDRIQGELAGHPGCGLRWLPRAAVPEPLMRRIVDAELFFWRHAPLHRQIMALTRWSRTHAARTRDGVPWQAQGIPAVAATVLRFCDRWPVQAALNRLGMLARVERTTRSLVTSAAGLGLISVRSMSRAALVAASRLHARASLHLHAAGYATQPFTPVSLYASEAELDVLPADWSADDRRRFAEGMPVLREAFGLGRDELPLWLFRVGVSPGPREVGSYTHRYELDRVLL